METLAQDIRYAWRGLRRSPGFALVAIITLALGIGANTAIFSVINAVLLRPLPYAAPGQLVRLYETEAAPGNYPFTGPDFLDWKTQNHSFQDMTLYSPWRSVNLSGEGEPDHVMAAATESNFFAVLGARPLLGRTWAPDEDEPGHDREAILSYGIWQSHFGGDAKIIGRQVEMNSRKYTVVGVMPAGFHLPSNAQIWEPLDMDSKNLGPRGTHQYSAIGRLKPGVTLQQAQAEMTLIASRLEKQFPDSNFKVGASLVELHEDTVGESRNSLLMMLWAVALVLLIACANVANLLLSRAVARQKEMAIRGALGAARMRLVRQLLTESLMLAISGGVLGLLLAWVGVRILTSLKNLDLPRANAIQIDPMVLGFTFGLAVLTGIAFGIFPALQTARPDLHEELKGGAGSAVTAGGSRRVASDALVVAEVGLSLLLLISAGLLLKDFVRMRNSNIGVRSQGVWTATIALPEAKYKEREQKFTFSQSLMENLQAVPGLDAISLSDRLPLEGGSNSYVTLRGQPFHPMSGPLVENHDVSPDYFRAMGIPILAGRIFSSEDLSHLRGVVKQAEQLDKASPPPPPEQLKAITNAMLMPTIINQTMAREFWPNENPIGKMFSFGDQNGPWQQVIGVVGDVKELGLTHAAAPEAYGDLTGDTFLYVVVHSSSSASPIGAIRNAVAKIDSSLPLFQVRTMDEVIAENASGQEFLAGLLGLFSGLALLLAAVGIYGVLSYLVTQRTREIGIRMSLGASRASVLTLILRQGMKLAVIGFAIGILGALAAGRLLSSLLHDVKPSDPAIIAATLACLGVIALLACYLPARRAAKVDPVVALRHD